MRTTVRIIKSGRRTSEEPAMFSLYSVPKLFRTRKLCNSIKSGLLPGENVFIAKLLIYLGR